MTHVPKPVSVSITANASGVVQATSQAGASAKKMAADVTSAASKIDSGMDKAAAAAKRLATAERMAANAAGSVRLAESQLASVRAKSNATDTQKIKAEERLYAANRRLAASQAEVAEAGKALTSRGSFVQSITAHSSDIDRVSTSMLKFGTVGAAGLGLVAKAAIDWDSAWAGVTKTVNGTPQQLSAVESGLRGLARTLPESAEQIAQVAENAGQLGIKTPDILAFTKTMVELGDTTNLSSDEAATSFGQLLNVMGDAPATVGQLGDVLVKLGNNGASTERDILQLGTRLAGAGKQIGLTTPQVLAFGSAISSTGIEAEAGGTAMTQNFFAIDKAVRQGGKGLDLYARTAGMSSDQFRRAWGDDPASATNQFVEGLGKVQASGGSVRGVLDDLGITSVRQADVYARLAGATKAAGAQTDLLADSLKDAANAQGALGAEAAVRYATTASKVKVSLNKIQDDAISAGAAILPTVEKVASGVDRWADSFSRLSPEAQSFVTKAAGIGTVGLLVGGGLLTAASNGVQLYSTLRNLSTEMPNLSGKMRAGAVGVASITGALAALQLASTFLPQFKSDMLAATNALTTASSGNLTDVNSFFKDIDKDGPALLLGQVDSLGSALNQLNAGGATAFFGQLGKSISNFTGLSGSQLKDIESQFSSLDTTLGQYQTSGNGAKAAAAFASIRKEADLQQFPLAKLIDLFPTYSQSLLDVAKQAGVTSLSQDELADWMGGKVPAAVSKAAAANPQLAASLATTTAGITAQTKSLAELAAQASATSDALVAASNSEIAVQQALGSARQTAKANAGKGTNIKTAAGQANQSALNNIISTQHQNVQTEAALPHPDYTAIVKGNEAVKKSYVETARQMGVSSKQAKADADRNFKLPKAITSQIVIKTDKLSEGEVTRLNRELKTIPKEQRARIVTIAETKGAKAAETAIARVKDKQVIARALGESGGAKAVKKAMDALHDRLVLAKARGDASGARAVQAAIDALHNKTVYATVVKKTITTREERKSVLPHTGGLIDDGRLVLHRDEGGAVRGPGTSTSDSIPAMLSDGEVVIKTASARAFGYDRLLHINATGEMPGFAAGGLVGSLTSDPKVLSAVLAQQRVDEARSLKERIAAEKELTKATKKLNDTQSSVADAVKQLSTSLIEPYRSQTTDAQDMLAMLQQGAGDLTAFAAQVKQLKSLGLSQELIDQVTSKGATAGGDLAASIIAGGQTLVTSLNQANAALEHTAGSIGLVASGVKGYATGIPSAPAGLAWVGERGPELLNFRGGERVDTAATSRRILERNHVQPPASWSSPAPVVVQTDSGYHDHSQYHAHGVSDPDRAAQRLLTRRKDSLARRGLVGRKV